jgi:hypothetical protein
VGPTVVVIVQLMLVVNGVVGLESVTVAVKLTAPAAVGVPVMAPVARLSVNPVGKVPSVIENVYGKVHPDATRDEL